MDNSIAMVSHIQQFKTSPITGTLPIYHFNQKITTFDYATKRPSKAVNFIFRVNGYCILYIFEISLQTMIDLNTLTPEFHTKVTQLLANCDKLGYHLVPTYAIRTPLEQGVLWRQSRSAAEINYEIQSLQHNGCDYLANCIIKAGPHSGPHVTNAIPGLGYHQWGTAIDCVWMVNGKEEWSETRIYNGHNGYMVYAAEAKKLGLNPGAYWVSIKDFPHVQLSPYASPLADHTLKQVNDKMAKLFPL